MISINNLLDMIATEAVEEWTPYQMRTKEPPSPPLNYGLELVKERDGTYRWIEG